MNKKLAFFLWLSVYFYSFSACILRAGLGPFSALFNIDTLDHPISFTEQLDKEIDLLVKKRAEQEEIFLGYKTAIEGTQAQLNALKEKVAKASGVDAEFLNQYISLLTQTMQTVSEIEQVNQQIFTIFDTHIKLLQEYKQDPEFQNKNIYLSAKAIYSIDDLQKVSNVLLQVEGELKTLEERLRKTSSDLENRKKTQLLSKQEYEEKKKEQKEFKNREELSSQETSKNKFTLAQQGELIDAQEKLLKAKKNLADLRVKEIEQRGQLIYEQMRISDLQKKALVREYNRVKREMSIDEKDIHNAEESLYRQQEKAAEIQAEYTKHIDSLMVLKNRELQEIEKYKKQYNLSSGEVEAIASWAQQPTTLTGWTAQIEIGRLTNLITYEIDISKEYLFAQIDYEKTKVTEKDANYLIIQSWHKLTSGKLDRQTQEELAREIKQYEKLKANIQAHISSISDNRSGAANALNANARIAENCKALLKTFREQRDTIFKNHMLEYNRYFSILKDEAVENAHKRGEVIAQLIELYTNISNLNTLIIEKIDMMIDELKGRSQWRGTPPLWRGLQTFVPDIKRFFRYISEQDSTQSIATIENFFSDIVTYYTSSVFHIVIFIVQLLALFIGFWIFKRYMPYVNTLVMAVSPKQGIGYIISSFITTMLSFVVYHAGIFLSWVLLFFAVHYKFIADAYTGIIFYLISIPFWLYYALRFVQYLGSVNVERGYIFARQKYQRKFLWIFSLLLYATIIIIFFREAFLLVRFTKSNVPHILLAFNFIILQISLIGMINKDQILSIIPRTNSLWLWIYDHIKSYYYLFLAGTIFIIVMSNPYVGYGPQFFYIISRLLLIILLIPFFATLHNQIKRISSSFFFYSDGEVIRERFAYGRTSYGIFVIVSFLFFTALVFIIGANIWGYHIGFQEVYEWLQAEIYSFKNPEGRWVEVNALKLGKVLLYIIGGVVIAYGVNRFILHRMFDLLLVNIGIQSALSSLTRYIILLAAIVIGLQSIGMSSSLLYIFAVIGGLGVAGKEIITDFIGYFMILIQRPIKIGDFIRIDDEVMGVVRHVNFRSVVLRRKNSVTVIIPNSHVMTKPVVNWNYSRTFFAFDDILLTVPYNSDPCKVKELILKVLYNNINILKNPAPIVQLCEFEEHGFQFMIRGFLSPDKVLDQFDIASDLRLEIVHILRANNLKVAAPTRILKIVNQRAIDLAVNSEHTDNTGEKQ